MPTTRRFHEFGYLDMVFDTWQGVVTVRGLPAPVLETLNRGMVRALRQPDVVKSHEEQVNVVVASTPAEFERYIAAETARWAAVVRETGVSAG